MIAEAGIQSIQFAGVGSINAQLIAAGVFSEYSIGQK